MKLTKANILTIISCALLIITSIFKIPNYLTNNALLKLGYNPEEIKQLYKYKITSTVIENKYYSPLLTQALNEDNLNTKYLKLYTIAPYLNQDYFNLFDRLIKLKGYSNDDLYQLYEKLSIVYLRPLVVFDKVDISNYIQDCLENPDNTLINYQFDNDYLNPYQNVEIVPIEERSSISVYISSKSSIEDYVPEKLVLVPEEFAIQNIYMQSIAQDAFIKMCKVMQENKVSIYAVSAYQSYDSFQASFTYYSNLYYSEEKALRYTTKPGCSEEQSGLQVSVVASENESISEFRYTKAYNWLKENAHKYGFIIRYPDNLEALTGQEGKANTLRYVGVELAEKIFNSGMSFDEYYYLYLK